MTPEQAQYFLEAMKSLLLAGSEGIEVEGKLMRLRDSEFHTGARLIWLGKESNGYVNMTHEEAMSLSGTSAKSTLRYHLMRLRDVLVLRSYSTNGTVRAKIAAYPGSELIVHDRNSRTASTNSRMGSTPDDENSESREWGSRDRAAGQLLRDAGSRDRAAGQHFNRNFDDSDPSKLVSKSDLTDPSKRATNELTAVIDPVEEALSVAFLLKAGFWAKTAKQLAKLHRFELLRRAVGFWWCNRRSTGGEFDERPGIVIRWLADLESVVIPPLSSEFMASDLYRNHRTKDEIAEDEVAEADEEVFEPQIVDDDDPPLLDETAADESADPHLVQIWQMVLTRIQHQIPLSTYNTYLYGTQPHSMDEDTSTLRVLCSNPYQQDFIANRLRQLIKRTLASVTGRQIDIDVKPRRRG